MAIIQGVNTVLFMNKLSYNNALSVTAYLDVTSLGFFQEYSFTQLIQTFTCKNEPDIPSVRYKRENYICEHIRKNNFYKMYIKQDPNLISIRDLL